VSRHDVPMSWTEALLEGRLHDWGISGIRPSTSGRTLTLDFVDPSSHPGVHGRKRRSLKLVFRQVARFSMGYLDSTQGFFWDFFEDQPNKDPLEQRTSLVFVSAERVAPPNGLLPLHRKYHSLRLHVYRNWLIDIVFKEAGIVSVSGASDD